MAVIGGVGGGVACTPMVFHLRFKKVCSHFIVLGLGERCKGEIIVFRFEVRLG